MFGFIDKSKGYLFSTHDLGEILRRARASVAAEVDQLDPNRLLNTSQTDLEKYLVEKYRVEVPRLAERDVELDVVKEFLQKK